MIHDSSFLETPAAPSFAVPALHRAVLVIAPTKNRIPSPQSRFPDTMPSMNADLARIVAESVDGDAVVTLTQTLVRMDSVATLGRPHEAEVARVLAARLEANGFEVQVTEVAPSRLNVVATWDSGRPGRLLILEGHTDVVTEGDADAWAFPPFSGDIVDGQLRGRGSADMKGGLAAAIVAAETLKAHGSRLSGALRLLIPCDEEGMMSGIKRIVADGHHLRSDGRPADGAIICEPEELELCLFQRGGIRVAVTFTGRQAHGAMPYAGLNPIPALARFILELRDLQRALQMRLGEHPMLGHAWITPTVLAAGSLPQLNVMHADAMVALDIRTVPGVSHDELHATLLEMLARLEAEEGVRTGYEIIDDRPWTQTAQDSGIVGALEGATRVVLGREPRYGGVPGTTDGTFLHKAGVPIVTVGPGDREIPHQVNEFVRVEELVAGAKLYAAAGALFLQTPLATP
jgi:succinyl-diaminopimelate desuccinylase